MGDADSDIIVPVHEIEAWMDEALEVVDEGLDSLFAFMTNLNERTKQIYQELKNLDSYRRIFLALNLFIVPVIFSLIICYGTRGTLNGENIRLKAGFQTLVSLLMFLSASIGLPFYIYALWMNYRVGESIREDYRNLRFPSLDEESPNSDEAHASEESSLSLYRNDSSIERLNDFARLLSQRMPARMKNDLERRVSSKILNRSGQSSAHEQESSRSELTLFKELANSREEFSAEKEDSMNSNTIDREKSEGEYPSIHLQVYMNDSGQDLSIKVASIGKEGRKLDSDEVMEFCKISSENAEVLSSDNIEEKVEFLSAQSNEENTRYFDVDIKDIVF